MRLNPTISTLTVDSLIDRLWRCERSGNFEEALFELSEDWSDPHFEPVVTDLSELQSLELLLRFASLLGYQGHIQKIKESQLRARDILTGVLGQFSTIGNAEKSAECENHIALTYWRTGEFNEARIWLQAAGSRMLATNSLARLGSIMFTMLVNVSEQRYDANVGLFNEHEDAFREYGDDWLTASFYVNAGIGFMEAERTYDALRCYERAKNLSERSSIRIYLGSIENELAHVYRSLGKFELAHTCVDRGIDLCRQSGDITREGLYLDTKAGIFLGEGIINEAFSTATHAVEILRDGENMGYLAESLLTEAKVYLHQDNFTQGVSKLFEAVQIARTHSGNAFADSLIGQFEQTNKELSLAKVQSAEKDLHNLESGELALVLPPSLSMFDGYQGLWINNEHLADAGLGKGSLAIVVKDSIKRGDLVAITELATGEISCGFFDSDFGVVCLEGCNSEPQLFDQQDVKIIGKIIGVSHDEKDADGKLIVRPLLPRSESTEI
ncbi:MAG TPA: tetratricopeptide repeat protein [Pyrinomonadaceae bacterium]|nr:tetratricopeptide repeat protein [Pyrinomonadaceae bacterium]